MKKAFVLGGSSDIGVEIIKIYLRNGYFVIAHYNKMNKKLSDLQKLKKNLILKRFNFLNTEEKIEKFLNQKEIIESDVLINALGYLKQIDYKRIKIRNIIDTLKVNFFPSFYLTKILGPKMYKKKWGRIVNLGSIGVKFGGNEYNFPYSLSKHMLEFFPKATSSWTKKNVLINTVRVGVTKTKIHNNLPKKNIFKRIKLIPMKRMASPKEIAQFIFFLGSSKNSYISNQILSISGGE